MKVKVFNGGFRPWSEGGGGDFFFSFFFYPK